MTLVWLWNHPRICSWNQPVLSNKGKVSCSRKQRGPLMGLEPTTSILRVRRATHCATPHFYMSPLYINMFLYLFHYLSVLSFFLHMLIMCVSSFSKKTVVFLSWITCNVMHVYFVFQTMYIVQVYWNKLCSVLFLSIQYVLSCALSSEFDYIII